jgi:hypothetical protein
MRAYRNAGIGKSSTWKQGTKTPPKKILSTHENVYYNAASAKARRKAITAAAIRSSYPIIRVTAGIGPQKTDSKVRLKLILL